MYKNKITTFLIVITLVSVIAVILLFLTEPVKAVSVGSCQAMPGQVLINEVLPAPSNNGIEWVELYNTSESAIDIGYCYIDDSAGGSAAYQIPIATVIPSHGFWTVDRTSYFNNGGDTVRFLKEDVSTVLDTFTYGNTGYNVSWYRNPDGGAWAAYPTSSPTKGQFNAPYTPPTYPIVLSILRADPNPTNADNVNFIVTFSKAVMGVDTSAPFYDFAMLLAGLPGASIIAVSGSGTTYTVMVNTGPGSGSIQLVVVDDDSIRDASNLPLGGEGWGNGNYTGGEIYTIGEYTFFDVPVNYWAWSYIEQLYAAGITSGCAINPLKYCPGSVVTRDQMAVFLLKGKHGASYVPPPASGVFADVPANYWAAAWIEQLAREGITSGCSVSPAQYCPGSAVTRDQMAVFLLKAKHGSSYVPAVATGDFADVPQSYWAAAWIEELAAEGITGGCATNPLQYCPGNPVTRDQMAVFLVKNFNLP